MDYHLRLPITLFLSLVMVSPIMGSFINGVMPLSEFLFRYLIALVISAVGVWIYYTIFDGYQRANDAARVKEMAELRLEEKRRKYEEWIHATEEHDAARRGNSSDDEEEE